MALSPRRWRMLAGGVLALLAAACAQLPPPAPGTAADEVRRAWGTPTGTYTLPSGTRLEYATGPYGRTTWMIDLDAAGRVARARQVLTPETLFALPAGTLDRAALQRELGRPGEVRGVRGGGQTWYWRYETNDCLWMAASITPAGVFAGGSLMVDPGCDAKSDGFD